MLSIQKQKDMLKTTIEELESAGVLITGVYMPTSDTDAGVEIDQKYILQIADYHTPNLILDTLDLQEVGEFDTTSSLISFLMEKQ